MAKLERNSIQQRSGTDPGRARKRKIMREKLTGITSQAENSGSKQSPGRSRVSSRRGPSTREQLVSEQIKDQSNSIPSIRGKLSSALDLGSRQSKDKRSSRPSHRETEPRETYYEATPRAETQRISHPETGSLPRKNRRVFDARTEVAPPVMVRGGMGGMAFGRTAASRLQKQKPPRRRFDVPLKVTGAEVRLPAIPLLNLGWRAISLLMVLMMSASLLLMWKAPVFQVNSVEADGLKRLTVSDLNVVMGTFGKSIFSLNPNVLHEALTQAFPELSKISVKINLPASVKVVATERQPVISWTQDGVETWVDAEGISFPPRGEPTTTLVKVEGHGTPPGIANEALPEDLVGAAAGIPTSITANNPDLRLSPELVSSILALGAKMPAETLLVYDSQHGLGWNDPNGWEVFFGPEDQDMDMKLIVYQAMVERLLSEGIQPALISVEYVHAPYYRMER